MANLRMVAITLFSRRGLSGSQRAFNLKLKVLAPNLPKANSGWCLLKDHDAEG